jgi:hypothetical protein
MLCLSRLPTKALSKDQQPGSGLCLCINNSMIGCATLLCTNSACFMHDMLMFTGGGSPRTHPPAPVSESVFTVSRGLALQVTGRWDSLYPPFIYWLLSNM